VDAHIRCKRSVRVNAAYKERVLIRIQSNDPFIVKDSSKQNVQATANVHLIPDL
jgi:hypothetical protein